MFTREATIYLSGQPVARLRNLIEILHKKGLSIIDPQDGKVRIVRDDGTTSIDPVDFENYLTLTQLTLMVWMNVEEYIYLSQNLDAELPYISISFDNYATGTCVILSTLIEFVSDIGPPGFGSLFFTLSGRNDFEMWEKFVRHEIKELDTPPELVMNTKEMLAGIKWPDSNTLKFTVEHYVVGAETTILRSILVQGIANDI